MSVTVLHFYSPLTRNLPDYCCTSSLCFPTDLTSSLPSLCNCNCNYHFHLFFIYPLLIQHLSFRSRFYHLLTEGPGWLQGSNQIPWRNGLLWMTKATWMLVIWPLYSTTTIRCSYRDHGCLKSQDNLPFLEYLFLIV